MQDTPPLGVRILQLLRHQPLLPGELAEATGASPSEVHAEITRLQGLGVEIAVHPLLGCRLLGSPAQLVAEDLLARIHPAWPGEIWTLASTSSTNTLALEQGRRGLPGPLAIFAEHQTSGRGRFARAWESARGEGLWLSILLRPQAPQAFWPRLTTLAALALTNALERVAGVRARIKWPNDVMLGGRKVAGILAETGAQANGTPFVVLGIGLNVNQERFPPPLADTATSLRLHKGEAVDRNELAGALLCELAPLFAQLEHGFEGLLQRVKHRSCVLDQPMELHTPEGRFRGIAEDLDAHGHLLVRLPDGTLRSFNAGEVSLRPRA